MNGNNENSLDADWAEPERLQQELSYVFDSRRLALSRVGDLQADLETVQTERDDLLEINRVKNVQIGNLEQNSRAAEINRRLFETKRLDLAEELGTVQVELETLKRALDDLWQIHCGPDADAATQHPEGHEQC